MVLRSRMPSEFQHPVLVELDAVGAGGAGFRWR
jgi:hypothetical protein